MHLQEVIYNALSKFLLSSHLPQTRYLYYNLNPHDGTIASPVFQARNSSHPRVFLHALSHYNQCPERKNKNRRNFTMDFQFLSTLPLKSLKLDLQSTEIVPPRPIKLNPDHLDMSVSITEE